MIVNLTKNEIKHLVYLLGKGDADFPELTQTIVNKLQPLINLQNKILRIITKSSYTSSARQLFIKLNFLPLTQIYQNNLSILLYKIMHNNNLTTTYNLQQIDQIHQHDTSLASNSQ